jgi:hypothetical protein
MTIRQQQPVSPPRPEDRDTLNDYSAIFQDNFVQLFEIAHRHTIRSTAPASNEGNVTDIFLVEDGSTFKLYAKFTSGWKSVVLS